MALPARGLIGKLLWVAVLAAAVGAAGCKKKGAKKIPRSGDAAPVEFVEGGGSGVVLTEEVEPNDEAGEAMPVELGRGARGTVDGESDVDLYAVEVSEAGFIEAVVGGIDEVDLILELRDGAGEVLARSDRGPAQTAEGVPNFPVEAGTYQVAIREFVKKRRKKGAGREGKSPPYELQVRFAQSPPSELHEVEPNDSADGAAELIIADDHAGWIGWHGDTDMWKLSLEGFTSHYALDLDLAGVPGAWLQLEILDGGGAAVLSRKAAEEGEPLAVRNLVPDEDQRHYYLKLSARRSNPIDGYTLTSRTRLLDLDEEIEPNDDAERATALRETSEETDGTRRGHLTRGDVDFYRLEAVGAATLLTVSVSPPAGLDVALEIASGRGAELGGVDAAKAGGREEMVAVAVPAGTSVVIKVSGSGDARDPYELRWSVQPDDGPAGGSSLDDFGYDE